MKTLIMVEHMFIATQPDGYNKEVIKYTKEHNPKPPTLVTSDGLLRIIPNLAGPLTVDGENVTWYWQYGGRHVDKSYEGTKLDPLVDKIF